MAQTIRLKRSAVAAKAPLTTDLALGELAINTYDGKMYFKKNVLGTDSIIELANVGHTHAAGDITSGTLAVANGGTGASTAATALTNLGAAADSDVVKLTGNQTIAGVKTFSSDGYFNSIRIGAGPGGTNNTVVGNGAGATLTTNGNNNTLVGYQTGDAISSGTNNTAVGFSALSAIATNGSCTAVGHNALLLCTGSFNTALGQAAGDAITTGENNTVLGRNALTFLETGSNCTAVGLGAGRLFRGSNLTTIGASSCNVLTLGNTNCVVGYLALTSATTKIDTVTITTAGTGGPTGPTTYNNIQLTYVSGPTAAAYPTANITVTGGAVTAVTIVNGGSAFTATSGTVLSCASASIGNVTGFTCTTATGTTPQNNTIVGQESTALLTTGQNNVALGSYSLYFNTTGISNFALGQSALYKSTSSFNIAIGTSSLFETTSGTANVGIGTSVFAYNTTGSYNTVIGHNAGQYHANGTTTLTDPEGSVYIGAFVRAKDNADSNSVVIAGYTATTRGISDGANTTVIGNAETVSTRLEGSLRRNAPVTKTADFTLGDRENWVINNKSGSSCTVTLPAASSWTGREVMFKNIQAQTLVSASSNVVPRAGGAAETAILAATAGAWATLVSDGTNWIIMQGS